MSLFARQNDSSRVKLWSARMTDIGSGAVIAPDPAGNGFLWWLGDSPL
jgi:hypothetical protein